MASTNRRTAWTVYGVIATAGLVVVFLNFSPGQFSKLQSDRRENIDREALSKLAPEMPDRAFHRRYKSEDQCITCHTQGVLGAKIMPHEPRENCRECHSIKTEA